MSNKVPNIIHYRDGYKYQLTKSYRIKTAVKGYEVNTPYIKLFSNGSLYIIWGYAWDGPSGPTYDSRNSIRASLVHDAFYSLLRKGMLPPKIRILADKELDRILKEDGMWAVRRWYWLRGVRWFAGTAASTDSAKKTLQAP